MAINLQEKLGLECDRVTDVKSVESRLTLLQKSLETIKKRMKVSVQLSPSKTTPVLHSQARCIPNNPENGSQLDQTPERASMPNNNGQEERRESPEALVDKNRELPSTSTSNVEHVEASAPRIHTNDHQDGRRVSASQAQNDLSLGETETTNRKRKLLNRGNQAAYKMQETLSVQAQCILHNFVAVFQPVLQAVPEWVRGPYEEFKDDRIRICDGCQALCEWIFFLVPDSNPERELCASCVVAEGFEDKANVFMREGATEYLTALDNVVDSLVCRNS